MKTRTELDHERLSAELIRVFRGKRSQLAFSRRLGYRCNTVYTWESRRRWPPAQVFFRAAQLAGRDPKSCLEEFFRVQPNWLGQWNHREPGAVAILLRELRGSARIGDVAARTGFSRFTVSRWLKGSSEPALPELLRYVEVTSLRLLDFIAVFADPGVLPSAAVAWANLQALRRLAYEMPWTHAVLRALELDDYRALPAHRPGWIARRLGISPDEEAQCLQVLARTGQATIIGEHWVPRDIGTVDTRQDEEANKRMKQWWAEVAVQKLKTGARGLFSYNLFTVSAADMARIQELHVAYFNAVRGIVAESRQADHVVLANLQLFRLDG